MIEQMAKIRIHYPDHTRIQASPHFRERRIVVTGIRDIVEDPLTVEEFLRRPYIRRSRYLARAFDLELQQYRNFYLGVTPEYSAPTVLRVGVFCESTRILLRLKPGQFGDTIEERGMLRRLLGRWRHETHAGEMVGVFCPGMRLS